MKSILLFLVLLVAGFSDAQTVNQAPLRDSVAITYQAPAPAVPKLEYNYLYDFKSKASLPVATYSVGTIHDLFRIRGFNVEALGLLGLNANNQQGTLGFAGAISWDIAREITLRGGLAFRTESADLVHIKGGLFLGISFHL